MRMFQPPAASAARARVILAPAGAALVADVLTKQWAEEALVPLRPVQVLGDLLQLTLSYNTGVAFGLFAYGGEGLLLVTGAIIAGLLAWLLASLRPGSARSAPPWPTGLVLGGALANFLDRLPDGRVTDFLDAGVGALRWPAFNLADSAIVVGVFLLALLARSESQTARAGL